MVAMTVNEDYKNNPAFRAIRALAADLELDQQKSGLLCPNCRGGQGGETSLSLTRNTTGIAFLCHRDNCSWKGNIPWTGPLDGPDIYKRERITQDAKKFYGKLEELPENIRASLSLKYNLSNEDMTRAGWLWSPEMDGGRVCMPILNRFARNIGHSFRTLDRRKKPKNRILLSATGEPLLCWYKSPVDPVKGIFGWSKPVVLVEDQISALRASKFMNAVALMGTNLNNEKVLELRKCQAPAFYLALDEDAKQTAIRYKGKYDEMFPNGLKMLLLKKDIKDCTDEEIKELLGV